MRVRGLPERARPDGLPGRLPDDGGLGTGTGLHPFPRRRRIRQHLPSWRMVSQGKDHSPPMKRFVWLSFTVGAVYHLTDEAIREDGNAKGVAYAIGEGIGMCLAAII